MAPPTTLDPGWDPGVLANLAQSDDAEAVHRLALMAGIGLGRPHDPPEAMALLARAAGLGHVSAARSLALIQTQPGGLEGWFAPPEPRRISERPHVLVCETFVSPEICDWLTDAARDRLSPAEVYDLDTGEGRLASARTNSAAVFDLASTDMVLVLVRERLARLAGLPVAGLEPSQALHYRPGQAFDWHVDFLDPAVPGHRDDLARRGQRIATALLWLSADCEGGETAFSTGDLRLKGRKGDVVLWANVMPDGRPDPLSRHAGLPPMRGEKWVLSQWMRGRAASTEPPHG